MYQAYGVFNDEGVLESYDSREEADSAAAAYRSEDPDHAGLYSVGPVCSAHPDYAYGQCEECGDLDDADSTKEGSVIVP